MKLTLKNFMSHSDKIIEFKPGINFMFGPNGSGKSSIYDAIRFVFGLEIRGYGRNLERLIKVGQKSCKVTLELAGYVITRSKSKSTHTLKIKNESKSYQSESLEDIVPVAKDIFGIEHHILEILLKTNPMLELKDRQAILSELTLSLDVDIISKTIQDHAGLSKKSSDYGASRIKSSGIKSFIDELAAKRVELNRQIVELDKAIAVDTALAAERSVTEAAILSEVATHEKELADVDHKLSELTIIKQKLDAYAEKIRTVRMELDRAKKELRELVDSVEKHWIPEDLAVIKCQVKHISEDQSPVLTVGTDSVIEGNMVDLAVLPDSSQNWDEGPLTQAREDLENKVRNLDGELLRLTVGHDDNTTKETNAGKATELPRFDSQYFDHLGARSKVLRNDITTLRRQLARIITGSKGLLSIPGGETVPAQSGQAVPGPGDAPGYSPLNGSGSPQAGNEPARTVAPNEAEGVEHRLQGLKQNRVARQDAYDNYDKAIRCLDARGPVQKTLAGHVLSGLNGYLAESSQVYFDDMPALPRLVIDEAGNVDSNGVPCELRSVGERLVDLAQIVCAVLFSVQQPKAANGSSRTTVLFIDDINDLDRLKKQSLLAWLTLLKDRFTYIVLATCGAARPLAPEDLINCMDI